MSRLAAPASTRPSSATDRAAILWGAGLGIIQAATPRGLWQHRTQFVANTRWWPPFCMAVDFVVAAIIVVEIAAGLHFR